jgi:hypothetical protein
MIAGLREDMAAAWDANQDALGRLAALLALDAGQQGGMMLDLRESLAWANSGVLAEKIVPEDAQSYTGISFPTVSESYINPRYRLVRSNPVINLYAEFIGNALATSRFEFRPSDEQWWDTRPQRDDFDLMLAAHVISSDATRLPMLLLGHPGAGKSMLTKVLAARLPDSAYTVVRVPLRRVGANAPVRVQIEQALAEATGGRVDSWWKLAAQSQGTTRVVLLDGLDELLQASQDDRSGYLQEVMEFQRHEAEQRQPVVVIVTSRTVVADRVDIPDETAVVKLDFFGERDIADWLERWRRVNAAAVAAGTMRALTAQSVLGTPDPDWGAKPQKIPGQGTADTPDPGTGTTAPKAPGPGSGGQDVTGPGTAAVDGGRGAVEARRPEEAGGVATGDVGETVDPAGTGNAKATVDPVGTDDVEGDGGQDRGHAGVRELARQPLLLLMLALYAADPAVPPLEPDVASAELYQRLMETFCRREAAKALGARPPRGEVDRRMLDHLDRLEIAAFAMFNRGRQDIGEEELGADLAVLDPRLMERSRPAQMGQRIIGEFLFVHAPEARTLGGPGPAGANRNRDASWSSDAGRSRDPGGADTGLNREPGAGWMAPMSREAPRRSYEFLHATFGEYLVASRVMGELGEAAAKAFAGRRGPSEPDDDLLYALLSHQALAARVATLAFAGEIFARMSGEERGRVLAVLELLLGGCRHRQGSAAYAGYRPRPADTVRELACYSANLVALRTWLEPGQAVVPLGRLLGHAGDGAPETARGPSGTMARLPGGALAQDAEAPGGPESTPGLLAEYDQRAARDLFAARDLLDEWRSMVMLWKSGLDPDDMHAMLVSVTLHEGGPGDGGPGEGGPGIRMRGLEDLAAWRIDSSSVESDIFLARLTGRPELAERIRYGAASTDNYVITFQDTPWKDEMASWLIPAIAGHRVGYACSDPPPDTDDLAIRYVAELIFRYLRTPRRNVIEPETLLKLLFRMPRVFELDALALAAAVISDPELPGKIPQLRDPDIYKLRDPDIFSGNPPLVLLLPDLAHEATTVGSTEETWVETEGTRLARGILREIGRPIWGRERHYDDDDL